MANELVQLYRKYLADTGQEDKRDDMFITKELGDWAHQTQPDLFDLYPDFGEEWGKIREANAPSLMEEGTRAFKRAGIGLGSTALGGAALVTGSDYLKRKAAALQMQASDPDLASTIPTLEDIAPGRDGPGQAFTRDAVRYAASKVGEAVPSIGEAVALSATGGLIGSAVEPGAGTIVGAGAGAVEGLIGRGIIRKAIQSLINKGITEEALVAGLRKGVPEVIEAVTKNAKAIAGARAGTVTAGLNSFLLNAGDVYSENDDRGVAAGLGLISAIPDTVLPALVVKKMFPGVSLSQGREAAKELVGSNAMKLAKAAGVTSFEGATESFQEAVNIVARNLKDNVDPFTITDADKIRIREAGITGAVGGALASPAIAFERDAEVIEQQPEVAPPPVVVPPAPLAPPPAVAVTLLPTQRVRAMSPEQQVQRLTELDAKDARTADEEKEYQILLATVSSRPAEAAVTEPAPGVPLTPPAVTLPEPGAIATPDSTIPSEAAAPVPVALPPSPAPTLAQDIAAYKANAKKFTALIEKGETDTPEFQRVFALNEEIKNRHGGMPPGEVSAEAARPESISGQPSDEERLAQIKATPPAQRNPADVEWANNRSREAVRQKEVERANAAKKMAEESSVGRYVSDMAPMQRAKVEAALNRSRVINGKPDTQAAYIERAAKAGASVVIRPDGRRAIQFPDGRFLYESDLSKAALDYAEHLIKPEEITNALREPSPEEILQREPSQAGEAGGGRGRVEPSQQGPEAPAQESPAGNVRANQEDVQEVAPTSRSISGEPARPDLSTLSESRLLSLAKTLGIDPRKMSGDRLRARIESNAHPDDIAEALGQAPAGRTAQTSTPEFKAWFGDSKVVDAEGKPLVVYHGTTNRDVTSFSAEKSGSKTGNVTTEFGSFFSDSPAEANRYAKDWGTDGGNVVPAYVSLKNPYLMPYREFDSLATGAWNRMIAAPDYNPKSVIKFGDVDAQKKAADKLKKYETEAQADVLARKKELIDAGYDGIVVKVGGNTEYIAFSPTQIKSAIGNRGTFDPTNPDITARTAAEPVKTSTEPTNPAVQAQRTQEFQAVMGRLVANGANVQVLSQELLAQQTGEILQQQIAALEARLAAATTAPQRNALQEQLALRQERLAEVQQMRGVTFNPYHIAIALDDVMNASLDNLVTLLHEAAESLTMRLSPALQGAVFRAVEAATAQMQARMQAAAKNTGATVANVPVPSELLAETLAQTLAAEGIQDAPSLAQAIVRWLKEIYYRVAMAAQKAFGAEPSPELALQWYENQLRREVGGDYQYDFGNLLDRFLPQPNRNFTAKFSGASGTPGGMPDFFDPTTGKLQQPWVEPLSDEALAWNMKFQTVGANPGEAEGIPAEEAVARQSAASYSDQIEWIEKLHKEIAPAMDLEEFIGLVSRGEKTPYEMRDALERQYPGISAARIGGERMTDAMNKWAAHQSLKFMKGVQAAHLSRIAKMQEAVADADERFTEHASELNRLEPDVRNAELHEGELKKKARAIIDGLLKSYKNGLRTSSKLGRMIEAEEDLGDRDPLPQFYVQAFTNLLNADIPLFDYVEAIALLDLPLEEMTPEAIWKAVRDNADTSEKLRELSRNKPLGMTLAVLAKNNTRQLDQIQLRRSDAQTFLDIRAELEGIRNATEAQLRVMLKTIDEKAVAKGLRQRIKTAYLKERRALKRASDRMAMAEERIRLLEEAKPAVAEKVAEMQQAIGGVFSEWNPGDGSELTVMRRLDSGNFQKATRILKTNADGSYEDSDGILNDLAQNEQWLKANAERAGTKEYEQVRQQTRAMQMLDVQRAYQAHNYGKVMGFIDAFVRPLQAIAKQAGHSVGNRIVQQFNKYEFINRSGAKALQNQSYEWGAAEAAVMKSLGIKDVGQFRSQIYNPVKFWLGVNPGLDQGQAIRGAIAIARKHLTTTPPADFNDKFTAFLMKDKQIEDELLRTAEQNGVLVWDDKLGELRKAIARGWSTGMRTMNDGVVVTLVHDMEKAGWKLEFDKDEAKKSKKVVTRSATFDALNPAKGQTPEEKAEYYAQLDNADLLRTALQSYFTPDIIRRWLLPFINKPGEPVFIHDGRDISQLDLQNAWVRAKGDVVTWIDLLGQSLDIKAEEEASPAASFRWDMLRQIDHLFRWEAKMAYEAEQTPDLFDNQGTKLHVMMDARVNDLMPEEHVSFAMHDPTSVRQMLGQIAFHGAFGRNGAALMANLKELEAVSAAKKFAFDGLQSTTVEGKRREAKAKGLDYDELKRAVDHYHDVLELKGEIESAMGVKNIYGPLYDARAGMELLGFMVGQVVDQPKTGALNFLSIGARPFAMHSFSPKVLKATAMSYGDLAKNTFGGLLRDFGIDLVRMSDYAKETGEVEGKAFRRLPFGTVVSGDTGKNGAFQDSLAQRFVVQPLRIFKALQRKGVGPGIAAIPGLGTMQRFATEGAMANIRGQTYLLQEIINNGIRWFSAHPEDLANPAFRFDHTKLKLRGDRGMYDWFRNKTVEYNMGAIEKIVRDALARQQAGERTITTEMVEQLAQMNAQELDGASSINTAPAGLAQNPALKVMLPLLRWPLWMMHAAHEGLADANGRADFKSMLRGIGRLAAWNLPLGLAFTFLIDEYDEKILRKKNAMPEVSKLSAIPVVGVPLALANTPREIPKELLAIGQRMIRTGNIYGLGADMAGAFIAPFDPGSGQRAFSLDQRVLIMSQFLNLTQAVSNMVSQGGVATWGSVYRPMVASIGGNGMLNSLDVVNNMLGLDNAESRLTARINSARLVSTAAKELGIETKKASGFSAPSEMSVWTREMQLASMANSRADFMDAYRKALAAAREKVAQDDQVAPEKREQEALQRVLASWRSRNPFSGLLSTPTPEEKAAMLRAMDERGRADVMEAMRYYDAYTQLITPSVMDRYISRQMRPTQTPAQQMDRLRRQSAGMLMAQ